MKKSLNNPQAWADRIKERRSREERRWCPTCSLSQIVEETTSDSVFQTGHEVEFGVTWLACGHALTYGHRRAGAPGAPYTGGVTSPTTRPEDLAAARAKQAATDPWADVQ